MNSPGSDCCVTANLFFHPFKFITVVSHLQLFAMDVSAQTTMKDAANCDKRCEWQNSANQKNAERILRSQVIPESMSRSGRSHTNANLCVYVR